MTNPRGRVFLSYRRSRVHEVGPLSAELNARGVPTWRDVESLRGEPTENAIREVLSSPETSGAILWLTPDVIESAIVREVEVPLAVARRKRNDGFWLIIVLSGGLTYGRVTDVLGGALGTTDLSTWNVNKISESDATAEAISTLSAQALWERVAAVTAASSSTDAPRLTVGVDAKGTPAADRTTRDLHANWTGQFASGPPTPDAWDTMARAAKDIGKVTKAHLSDNGLVTLDGTPSLPAATLLGAQFSTRDGVRMTWLQRNPNGDIAEWTLSADLTGELARDRGWRVSHDFGDSTSSDVALCVQVNASVASPIGKSDGLPRRWRATVTVDPPVGRDLLDNPLEPDEAVSLVLATVTELRKVRDAVHHVTAIHGFIAAPAGFGAILGSRLATLPPLVTYEFITETQSYIRGVSVLA